VTVAVWTGLEDILPHRVTVQSMTISRDSSGGTVESYADLATDVKVLITQQSGTRGRFDQDVNTERATISGADDVLIRQDTRLLVTTGPVEGAYFRVSSVSTHGPADPAPRFYRLQCDRVYVS
jgi:hypothetical protein